MKIKLGDIMEGFPEHIINDVKERNEIVDVISDHINVKQSGNTYKALCPFHSEKTPSFVVNKEKQIYKCFGCGEGGDAISFIMKIENLDFIEAVKYLAQRVNMQIDFEDTNVSKETSRNISKYLQINKHAAKYYYQNLKVPGNPALNYLKNRGYSIRTISQFGIGYAKDSWNSLISHLKQLGYAESEIEKAGLIIPKKKEGYYDRFRNRVLFPIFDVRGNVIAFGGRVLDESLPKYLNSPETELFNKRKTLYNLNNARKNVHNNQIIVVEGYTDVIALYQEGIKNVVATLGTAFTKDHGNTLKRYCNEIVICFDGDSAGAKATSRGIETLKELDIRVKIAILPEKIDPDEYIKTKGRTKFYELIHTAMSLIDYKIFVLKQQYNINILEEKIEFSKEIVKVIKQVKSHIEKDLYINKVHSEFDLSIDALKQEIYGKRVLDDNKSNNKYTYNNKRNNNKYIEAVSYAEQKGHIIAERQLINILIKNTTKALDIVNKVKSTDFLIGNHQRIVEYIKEKLNNKILIEENIIINDLPELKNDIYEIVNLNMKHVNIDVVLNNYEKNLKKYKLLYELKVLQKKQHEVMNRRNTTKEEVDQELLNIGIRIMEINRDIQSIK
ncbi:DNA primase [Serpentinicella sp. ANB-PHB4]|uniref:DNA primase n=1 Tax=Serpentinicella sp. ANB-PHB4 TaxID=3074076 RepID=UPI002857BC8E|nr:DNA primase [Serpentinicella sp. ANB-PHB4]MDR5657998.1 DNA primase [Serpentinicella sp. ANB-PHB4]